MIDIKSALNYLNHLWTPDKGAFREAIGLDFWYHNDNYVASLVMRKYDPPKYAVLQTGILKGYIDTRWCVLVNDIKNFKPSPQVLPDWLRYADLVELQFIYLKLLGQSSASTLFGAASKMYGLKHPGYIFDKATPLEGYTNYKLCLFALCALRNNQADLAGRLIQTVSNFQVKSGEEAGGIKTEYIPPEWQGNYPQLLGLANCETTSLAIMAQDAFNSRKTNNAWMTGGGIAGALIGTVGGVSASRQRRVIR